MGFFIHDLHRQIEHLHQNQISQYRGKPFTVYRGQGLSNEHFQKLKKTRGGLMSFNSFLSTSKKRDVSFDFAQKSSRNPDMVGILFEMTIDPKITCTPFADIQDDSYFQAEAEILFSMHTVFRIGSIRSINKSERLFEVQLTLTADDDEGLRILTRDLRDHFIVTKEKRDCSIIVFTLNVKKWFYLTFCV